MADNYLEKKFEEHAARSRSLTRHIGVRRTVAKGGLFDPLPPFRVAVVGDFDHSRLTRTIVQTFRKAGCRTAFCDGSDNTEGQQFAESTGSRFIPGNPSLPTDINRCLNTLVGHWGNIDVLIDCRTPDLGNDIIQALASAIDRTRSARPASESGETPTRIIRIASPPPGADIQTMPHTTVLTVAKDTDSNLTARFCLFLCMPANSDLTKVCLTSAATK